MTSNQIGISHVSALPITILEYNKARVTAEEEVESLSYKRKGVVKFVEVCNQ